MTPIMMDETTKDTATKATKTQDTMLTISVTEDMSVPTISV